MYNYEASHEAIYYRLELSKPQISHVLIYLLSLFCISVQGSHRLAGPEHAGPESVTQTWSGAGCGTTMPGIC
jgi:hypothetical protein